jgi:hypothetical protein
MIPRNSASRGDRGHLTVNQVGVRAAFERLKGRRDILGSPDFPRGDPEAECAGRCRNLIHLQHEGGIADIGHDRQSAQAGDNFAQKSKSLGTKII